MAEIEIGCIARQGLGRWHKSVAELERTIAVVAAERNAQARRIQWQFTCETARERLTRLYPDLTQLL